MAAARSSSLTFFKSVRGSLRRLSPAAVGGACRRPGRLAGARHTAREVGQLLPRGHALALVLKNVEALLVELLLERAQTHRCECSHLRRRRSRPRLAHVAQGACQRWPRHGPCHRRRASRRPSPTSASTGTSALAMAAARCAATWDARHLTAAAWLEVLVLDRPLARRRASQRLRGTFPTQASLLNPASWHRRHVVLLLLAVLLALDGRWGAARCAWFAGGGRRVRNVHRTEYAAFYDVIQTYILRHNALSTFSRSPFHSLFHYQSSPIHLPLRTRRMTSHRPLYFISVSPSYAPPQEGRLESKHQ